MKKTALSAAIICAAGITAVVHGGAVQPIAKADPAAIIANSICSAGPKIMEIRNCISRWPPQKMN